MKKNLQLPSIYDPARLVVLLILVFIVVNNIYFYPTNTISYDVFGYYMYLPLTFIVDGSSNEEFEFLKGIISTYNNSDTLYQIQPLANGDFVLKYTSGWAVCYAPFFFIAHIIASFTSFPVDGFSQPYQIAVFVGSLFYTLVGIYYLLKIANHYFSRNLSVLLVVLIVFGTNYLFHNTVYGQNAMSHNLLFTAYTLIIWLTIKWYENQKLKTIIYLGIVCGLVILTRPTEIVCLLIPLLWPLGRDERRQLFFKKYKKQLLIFSLLIIAIGSIQLVYWKLKAGQFLFFDYGNPAEGLDFLTPHTLDTLFSFRKGWYIYTPLMLVATIGFVTLYRKNKPLFVPLFTFFILNLYLVSSWSCWWYATSFSQRALIPAMVIMMVPLGCLLRHIWEKQLGIKVIFTLLLIAIVSLNIFQTMQYYRGVIPGDRMTKEYYFATFGALKPDPELKKTLLLIDRNHPEEVDFRDTSLYSKRILYKTNFEDEVGNNSQRSFSGKKSYEFSEADTHLSAFKRPYSEITDKDHLFIRVTAKVYKTKQEDSTPTLLTTSFDYKNAVYKWENASLQPLPVGEWSEVKKVYLTPETRTLSDRFTVQFWHRNNNSIYIDDLIIEVYEPK
ncbi:MAG: glycosyltransferase family 39 protein [Brumimicrobium sp.]